MNTNSRTASSALRSVPGFLRAEPAGGVLLVLAAATALIIAQSPLADAYRDVRDWSVGPESLHLHLTVGEWTSDGLLTLFFFLAGLELKREFVGGALRSVRRAAVPVAAAVGGMAAPAAIYWMIVADWGEGGGVAARGWAIPTATDIAFALAILAVVGRHLPTRVRTFLLTLAIADDLLAIVVIAVFYSDGVELAALALSIAAWLAFTVLIRVQRRPRVVVWPLLAALALVSWAFMHASGVHATVAGVLVGFSIPVARDRRAADSRSPTMADRLDHVLSPISAGFAVPVFAFFAAGVPIGGFAGLETALHSRVTLAVTAALVVGKTVGIFVTAGVVGAAVRAPMLRAADLVGVAVLGGIGFTVSLLIAELAFGDEAAMADHARLGIVLGSLIAALVGGAVVGLRSRWWRIHAARLAS